MSVSVHFAKSDPEVYETYRRVLEAARATGPVVEEPKKTSIHLVRTSAFAGIATRKDALILTVKSRAAIESARVLRAEQASANRWHVEFRLTSPGDVDHDVRTWLREAYELAA